MTSHQSRSSACSSPTRCYFIGDPPLPTPHPHTNAYRYHTYQTSSPSKPTAASASDDTVAAIDILADLPYTPPSFIVVLFHDGSTHRVIVDASLDYCDQHREDDSDIAHDDDHDLGSNDQTLKSLLDLSPAPALAPCVIPNHHSTHVDMRV